MTLLLAADLAAVVLVACSALMLPALARPTLPFGVRVSADRAADPVIVAERRAFARLTVASAVGAAVVSVAALAVLRHPAVIGATVTVLVVAGALLYHRAHRAVRAAKLAGGWPAEHRQAVTVDTTFRTDPVRVPWPWALPALAVPLLGAGIGAAVYGGLPATLPRFLGFGVDPARRVPTTLTSAFEPVITQAAVTLGAWAIAFVLLRARPDLDAARPRGSARRYRAYLRGVVALLLSTAACLGLGLLISALQLWGVVPATTPWRVAAYLPLAALLGASLLWERKVGQAGHRLPALPGEDDEDSGVVQRDDDRHWHLAGTVYANRRDPALLLHGRLGTSWTVNLGHPVAWLILAALTAVTLLAAFGVVDLPRKEGLF
ncbi:MAG: hypothetical protein K0R62_420 [Nonomuraea muscovyensis]|nr:hypothetical protein [Nonomuraea muscovyensis]